MEDDRLATNIGPNLDDQLESETPVPAKQPKRRFIGRRAADQAAQSKTGDAGIEDSGAIQGVNSPFKS
jgi:2-(3-amino-3-carboxypropyl)histidine synthase